LRIMTLFERDNEIEILRHDLENPAGAQLLIITGAAGSGRTSLWQTALQEGEYVLFGFGLREIRELVPADREKGFRRLEEKTRELEQKVELAQVALSLPDLSASEPFEPRLRAVQAIPPEALHHLIRLLWTRYQMEKLSPDAAMFVKTGLEHILQLNAVNLGQVRQFVEQYLRPSISEEDWQQYLRPAETLAQAIGRMYRDHLSPVIVENYREFPGSEMLAEVIKACEKTTWIFVADKVPAFAAKLEGFYRVIDLLPLSQNGIATYYEKDSGNPLTPGEADWLQRVTGGLPLAVRMVSDLYSRGIGAAELESAAARTPDDPIKGLFLYFVEESGLLETAQRSALYGLALVRNQKPDFTREFMEVVAGTEFPFSPQTISELVREYPWLWATVNEEDSEWPSLHPVFNERLRQWLQIERNRFNRQVQEGLVEQARNLTALRLAEREKALVETEPDQGSLPGRVNDPQWAELVLDMAYYRWWLDEAVGWLFALPRMVFALAYSPALARRLYEVASEMSGTFYTEGREIMPCFKTLLSENYTITTPKSIFEEKLKAIETLESFSTAERGRWYKQENLGLRQGGKGSGEAELRGILRWFEGSIQEQAAQYDRAAQLYEAVLATNVEMPELKRVAARAGLYLAVRYRLKNARESALSALLRTIELNPELTVAYRLLLWQGIQLNRPDAILTALQKLKDEPAQDLYSAFALWLQERQPEALSSARAYAARHNDGAERFNKLVEYAGVGDDKTGLDEILAVLG
jgi:hypothetical protein